MDLPELAPLQLKILSGGLGWDDAQEWISPFSRKFGPELAHVGTAYIRSRVKIAFMGLNPHYSEEDNKEKGAGTRAWVEQRFKGALGRWDANLYGQIQATLEQDVIGWDYLTGESQANYTLPSVVKAIYDTLHLPIADARVENWISFVTKSIAMLNLFPVEGTGDTGVPPGSYTQWQPYGHVIPLLDMLVPDIVLVFHDAAWNHIKSKVWQASYGLTFLKEEDNYVAYRRQGKELWIAIYHFSRRTQSKTPMEWFEDIGCYWIKHYLHKIT